MKRLSAFVLLGKKNEFERWIEIFWVLRMMQARTEATRARDRGERYSRTLAR